MDKHAGCCRGNDEIFLLCDKVQKGMFFLHVTISFFEKNSENAFSSQKWLD
jgi:hypothetical protein